MPYPILDPTGTAPAAVKTKARRAPRRGNLHGATVGLLVNTKQNAAPFLDEVGRLLAERHGVTNIMARTKVNFAQPAPDELVKEMTTACDVIITGIGDCGSCSASAVADGIAFEAAGCRPRRSAATPSVSPPTRWPNSAVPPATGTRPRRTRWPCSPRTR